MGTTIAVIDDDPMHLEEINQSLLESGLNVICVETANELWKTVSKNTINVFIIGLDLRDERCIDIVVKIRSESEVGIIVISDCSSHSDRIFGFDIGIDDCISKPYCLRELAARVRRLAKRTEVASYSKLNLRESDENIVYLCGLKVNLKTRSVIHNGDENIHLTTAEFRLFEILIEFNNRVVSREYLSEHLHGRQWYSGDRVVDGLVSRLRRKVIKNKGACLIKSIRGIGYILNAEIEN